VMDMIKKQSRERLVPAKDLPMKRKDGSVFYANVRGALIVLSGERYLLEIFRDITGRILAEKELRFRNLILSTQQETSLDGILVVDEKGKVISVNRMFEDMWEIPRYAFDFKSDEKRLASVADKIVNPEKFMSKAKSLYASKSETSRDEILLKDGRTFDRYSAPMLDTDGKYFGRVWYFRDITERKRAEEARRKLEQQLRVSQKMEAIGSLAGGIAHDFNNLLTAILAFTGFAIDGIREDDPVRDDLLEVKKAGERAASLTRQLLAFSRNQIMELKLLDVNRVVTELEKMLRPIIGENIDLEKVLAPDLFLTLADSGQIEQVLMNLVVNARDAMPDGGKLTIETCNVMLDDEYAAQHPGVKPGEYVALAVSDTGCGMDDETQSQIFEPFFTTKETGKGTGLGLSTVYGIIKQFGGNVWVYSEPGRGTTFKVYLPRRFKEDTPAPGVTDHPGRTVGTETILVVEDEEAIRSLVLRILGGAGYTVLTAVNADDALSASERHKGDIHLLLTDVIMPGMDGKTFVDRLRVLRPGIRVLYMSGYADNAIARHGVLESGNNFIGKPFAKEEIIRKVREVLHGKIEIDA
jgi:two-component system cell cycle sensor histidine kinase/response regulator CckA